MKRSITRAAAATALVAGTVVAGSAVAGGQAEQTQTFEFTGDVQSFTVPADVCRLTVDAFGAAGNDPGSIEENGVLGLQPTGVPSFDVAAGGLGARATGTVDVTPGEVLSVYVGGQGSVPEGGFNGGGDGGNADEDPGGGGGGASDVRRGDGLDGRLVVAGGGGGGGGDGFDENSVGGDAGEVGLDGADSDDGVPGGGGATQSAGGAAPTDFDPTATDGALGQGGAGGIGTDENDGGGGGGGGYYGGGGGAGDDDETDDGGGGGGGSSFGPAGTTFVTGVNDGDGVVVLSWTVEPGCGDTPTTSATAPATQPVAETRPRFTG